jgi:hypothetical protein
MIELSDEKKLHLLNDYVDEHNRRAGYRVWNIVSEGMTNTNTGENRYPILVIVKSEGYEYIYDIVTLTYEEDNHIRENPLIRIDKVY